MKKFLRLLRLAPEDLHEVLRYHDRRHRPLEVESESGPPVRMMAHTATPGQYVGLGETVIRERRKRPRFGGTLAQYSIQLRNAEQQMLKIEQNLTAEGYINTIHDCWEKPDKKGII